VTVDSKYYIQPIANNGVLEYTFEMESIGDEALEIYTISSGVRTILASTEYTSSFGYRDPINTRGTITLNAALPEGTTLQVERYTPITNEQVFPAGKPFESEGFEYAIDKLTFILQELEGHLCDCRAAKTTPGYIGDPADPTDPDGPSTLPECEPYSCDAFAVGTIAAGLITYGYWMIRRHLITV